ncbi:MAG: hypothetical protein ACRDHW_16380 [Ktedonobacteraceae bacterium]
MVEQVIWLAGVACLSLILLRGLQQSLLKTYALFYIQASCVLVAALYLHPRVWKLPSYAQEYWLVQFVTMFLACGIMLEMLRHVLLPDPRSRRLARFICLILFAAVSCFALACLLGRARASEEASLYLERDFRLMEALLLLVIWGAVVYFGISMGRNIKGMFLGYGIYVAASLVILAFHVYQGIRFSADWYMLQPLSYDVGLIVWALGLWSYSPPPIPRVNMKMETKRGPASIIRWTASGSLSH